MSDDAPEPTTRDLARRVAAMGTVFASAFLAVILMQQIDWATAEGRATYVTGTANASYRASVSADGTVREDPARPGATGRTSIGGAFVKGGKAPAGNVRGTASAGFAAMLTGFAAILGATLAFRNTLGRWRWRGLAAVAGVVVVLATWLWIALPGELEQWVKNAGGVDGLTVSSASTSLLAVVCAAGAFGAALLGWMLSERSAAVSSVSSRHDAGTDSRGDSGYVGRRRAAD